MTPDSASGTADRPLHLLSVWNPSYADDAMDQHLEVLLGWAERRDRGEAEEDDVYVWWGKLRSPRREGELPHRDQVLALEDQIREGIDTHLYLTDHRSLYVARLVEVTDDPVLEETPAELGHMPDYYQGHDVDFWCRAWDFRRLVHNDTPAVVEELKELTSAQVLGGRSHVAQVRPRRSTWRLCRMGSSLSKWSMSDAAVRLRVRCRPVPCPGFTSAGSDRKCA